jgi:dienelactone hydrolase
VYIPVMTLPKRTLKRGLLALAALLVLAVAAFVWWALTPLGPAPDALEAMEETETVEVAELEHGIAFSPKGEETPVGVVFYPGGRVDVRSYAPLARDLADVGYLVVLVPMPLNLAVLGADRADTVISAYPDVEAWVVAGHSLGGAMAARFASGSEDVDALVLLAAYPPAGSDLSDRGIPVVSVYGTRDGVLDEERFSEADSLLPDDTRYVPIEGGNHARFGSYGPQPGDMDAYLSAEMQRDITLAAMGEVLLPLRIRTR